MSTLEALREKANIDGRRQQLDQFRADFALIYRTERAHGYATEDEAAALRAEAGEVIQAHMGDADWMARSAAMFHEMAETIRRDRANSERIAEEVRAEREKGMAA